MEISIRCSLRKTPVYDVYWQFAFKRQNVFFNRLLGKCAPWTDDPVLEKYKFTNVYRALDRVSQFLIRNIIRPDAITEISDDDRLFRIILFKLFNKIETWQLLKESLGDISWEHYSYQKYEEVLSQALCKGNAIYSAAYIMASGKNMFAQRRKHQNHLKLLEQMMNNGLCEQVKDTRSMAHLYELLLSYPLIGPFLAYQYATDINYSNLAHFSEEEFVKAGPGAQDGIAKCFFDTGTYSNEDVIYYMMDNQAAEFERLGLKFKSLFGRSLKLIDCQNLFCEVGKYARVTYPQIKDKSGRRKIKQIYRSSGSIPVPCFPEKWGLSSGIVNFLNEHGSTG